MSIRRILFLTAAFIGLAIGSARADDTIMRVKVPFEFAVQGHVLPPGTYDIKEGTDGPDVIWIKGERSNHSVSIAITIPDYTGHNPSGHQPTLVFTGDHKQPRLTEIWESNGEGRLLWNGTLQ